MKQFFHFLINRGILFDKGLRGRHIRFGLIIIVVTHEVCLLYTSESELAGSLHRAVAGDVDKGSVMAGQVACLVNDEKSAAQIVDDLVAEAQSWAGEGLQRMLDANARRAWNTEVR